MASKTKIWAEGDTWGKLAYETYLDSREFRALLDLNESFDIRTQPAQGVNIFVTPPPGVPAGITSIGATSLPGTLQQMDVNIDLRGSTTTPDETGVSASIFPWRTLQGYTDRLARYTAFSLFERDRVNGFSLDSPQATSDTQRG